MTADDDVLIRKLAADDIADDVVKLGWSWLEMVANIDAKSDLFIRFQILDDRIVLILA